jgi:hypothetical protein
MLDLSKTCAYSVFVVRQTHVAHVFVNSCFPACLIKISTIRNVVLQVKKKEKDDMCLILANVHNKLNGY